MSPSTLPTKPAENWEKVRDEWLAAVEQLVQDVEAWACKREWAVRRDVKTITEDRLGSYTVPRTLIHTPAGRLLLDPVARYVQGAQGLVDLYVLPSYDAVMIARNGNSWQLHTGGGNGTNRPWSEQAFEEIAGQLLATS
jgi:hypothetical protein